MGGAGHGRPRGDHPYGPLHSAVPADGGDAGGMSGQQAPGPAATGSASGWRDKLTTTRILVIVLVALAIILIAENTAQVRIRLIIPVVTMPLYAALLIMFVLGLLAGALLLYSRRRRKRRRQA